MAVDGSWSWAPVVVAVTFGQRLRGIRGVAPGHGVLLWGRSVHGHGLRRPLAVVAVDPAGTVLGSRSLSPGGTVRWRRPGWLLEVPKGAPVPDAGTPLVVVPAAEPCGVAGTLILCATPIGNLDDAPPRLREALAAAAVVYAEDTRRSKVLLRALGVDRPLRSYFVGNEDARAHEVGERLAAGETVALVTDAGVPGVADPGLSAVRAAVRVGAAVTVVPGPSAVTAALAVSGLPSDRFVFEGFLPRRGADRTRALQRIAAEERTVVLFAAKRRVAADLADLARVCGPDRPVVVGRELTKVHEEVWRGDLGTAAAHWEEAEALGEFTLVVGGAAAPLPDMGPALDDVFARIEAGTSLTAAVRAVAEARGMARRRLYEAAIRRRNG